MRFFSFFFEGILNSRVRPMYGPTLPLEAENLHVEIGKPCAHLAHSWFVVRLIAVQQKYNGEFLTF